MKPAAAIRLIAFLAVLAPGLPAHAQEQEAKPEEAQPKIETLAPAYEREMMDLAEILGALHYLRELCGAKEGQLWREQMQFLLANEEPSAERKARMIARFNRGYRGYQEIYRTCTPPAAEAANRHAREGVRLAAEIPARYGN
jgi:uncharacterized protein (TIGR02301 family)